MRNKLLIASCMLPLLAFPAFAVEHPLPNEAQETRAEELFHQIRCTACESESVAESPADVASAIRQDIRTRVAAGDDDSAIKQYLTQRYGDSVMMRPPLTRETALLWFGPTVLFIGALLVIWLSVRKAPSGN